MDDRFDPYHRWLAIPPSEQPANHYRLLGLANLEADADVIESAADRQMTHVRSHKSGKHAEHVDRVLNEIASAKIVLLDAEKKAEYDAQLRQKTAKPAEMPPPLAQPPAAEPPVGRPAAAPSPSVVVKSSASTRRAPTQRGARANSAFAPLLLALVGGAFFLILLVAGGAAAFWLLQSGSRQVKSVPTIIVKDATVAKAESPKGDRKIAVKEPAEKNPKKTQRDKNEPPPSEPPATDELVPPVDDVTFTEEPPTDPLPAPIEPSPPAEQESPGIPLYVAALFPAPPSEDLPPPPAADIRAQNAARIARLFPEPALRTFESKSALAKSLLKTARETQDDAASQFELFDRARTVAAEAGDVETALASAQAQSAQFQLDEDALLLATIETLAAATMPLERRQELVAHSIALIDDSLANNRFVAAAGLLKSAMSLALRNRVPEPIAALTARQKLGSEQYQAYKLAAPAIERLRTDPHDAEAALVVGKYYAFVKGDWQIGLPLLAAGSDTELRRLAELEMTTPSEATQQKSLADGWYAAAASQSGVAADRQRARARLWYDKAIGQLTGLAMVEAEKRLAELSQLTVDGGLPFGETPLPVASREPAVKSPVQPAAPKVVDLLAIAAKQLGRDWEFDDQQRLVCDGKNGPLHIPLTLPREYLLEAVVTDLEPKEPGVPWALGLGLGNRYFEIEIDERVGKRELVSGVRSFDGNSSSNSALAFRYQVMRSDRPNVVRYLVSEKRLIVNVNGVNILVFEGDMHRLGTATESSVNKIVLRPARHEWAISSLKLAALDGSAPSAEPASDDDDSALAVPAEQQGEASEPIVAGKPKNFSFNNKKVNKDVVAGEWQGHGSKLYVAKQADAAKLPLDFKPPSEYCLRLAATRRGTGSELAIGLVYQGVQCVVALDCARQTSSAISGQSLAGEGEKDFVVSPEKNVLPDGERVQIECIVQDESFSVSINGAKFLEFTGDPAWNGPGKKWAVPTSDTLFLGAFDAEFEIQSVQLAALNGNGDEEPPAANVRPK